MIQSVSSPTRQHSLLFDRLLSSGWTIKMRNPNKLWIQETVIWLKSRSAVMDMNACSVIDCWTSPRPHWAEDIKGREGWSCICFRLKKKKRRRCIIFHIEQIHWLSHVNWSYKYLRFLEIWTGRVKLPPGVFYIHSQQIAKCLCCKMVAGNMCYVRLVQ